MTRARVAGLILGFLGVVVLMSGELVPGGFGQGGLGQLAVLVAAVLYAFSSVFARKNLHGQSPVVQAFVPLVVADLFIWTGAVAIEAPALVPTTRLAWFALLWLGLLGSCVAYLLLFTLLHRVGPTRTTMVTYVFPVVGLVLGIRLPARAGDGESPDRSGDGRGRDPGGERLDAAPQSDHAREEARRGGSVEARRPLSLTKARIGG